jgi:hypothetical protein
MQEMVGKMSAMEISIPAIVDVNSLFSSYDSAIADLKARAAADPVLIQMMVQPGMVPGGIPGGLSPMPATTSATGEVGDTISQAEMAALLAGGARLGRGGRMMIPGGMPLVGAETAAEGGMTAEEIAAAVALTAGTGTAARGLSGMARGGMMTEAPSMEAIEEAAQQEAVIGATLPGVGIPEEAATTASRWGTGRMMGAFGGLMLMRRAIQNANENLAENAKVDFTENPADIGVAGGASMGTKEARESRAAAVRESESVGGRIMQALYSHPYQASLLEGPLGPLLQATGVNQWAASRFGVDFNMQGRAQETAQAQQAAEATDERQKKIDAEIRASRAFGRETGEIMDEPRVGSNKYDTEQARISSHYEKLSEAIQADYQATRKTADETTAYNAASQKLHDDEIAALKQVTDAQTDEAAHKRAQKTVREAQTNAEKASLAGDTATAQKDELMARVAARVDAMEKEEKGSGVQWYKDVGAKQITQGSTEIDEAVRFSQQQRVAEMQGNLGVAQANLSGDRFGAQQSQVDNEARQKSLEIQEKIDKLVTESGNKRSKSQQDEIDTLTKELGLTQQIAAVHDAEIQKARAQHTADLNADVTATRQRAVGNERGAEWTELQNRIKKELADSSPADQAQTRKLASAQISQFLHEDQKPFMGSMDQYLNEMQMGILRGGAGGAAADTAARAFQKDLDSPAKDHKDAATDLKTAAKHLMDSAGAIAKAFGAGALVAMEAL